MAGALLPSLAYYFLKGGKSRKTSSNDDSDDDSDDDDEYSSDEDMFGIETTGPSSKWNIMNAPYKVRTIEFLGVYLVMCAML
jgi:hypothetical protein